MHKTIKFAAIWVLATFCLGGAAHAATIAVPDSDSFSTAGTPPPGWMFTGGTWSSDGTSLTAGISVYSLCRAKRGSASDDYFVYDDSNPLSVSVDILPAVGGETSRVGFGFLAPVGGLLFDANGGRGYMVSIWNGGTVRLYRDAVQWDGAPVLVGSASITDISGWNTTFHTYSAVITYTGGTSADITVSVDGVPKITYTDNAFLPKSLGFVNFDAGLYTYQWPGYGTTQFDNWLVEYISPVPAGTVIRFQ